MKKIILIVCIFPFLIAMQCDEDDEQTIFRNNFKVKITNASSLNVGDTIWIEGRVSSKVYNSKIGDSTFAEFPDALQISIYKFVTPTQNYNATDAIDNFDLLYPNELIDFLAVCNNSTMTISPTLNEQGNFYKFKFGLKAKSSGDFIVKFPYLQEIENTERNLNLIDNYLSPNNDYLIGFNSCGSSNWALETDIGDYCFKVN